jgi:RNA polymerase sigma factor (TIGR02999 family)
MCPSDLPKDLRNAPQDATLTQLLTDWRAGEPQALAKLTPLIYEELRRLARSYMRGERKGHTLQATAVVHEAFMRLIHGGVSLQDRTHLFALASRLMRRVLVDHAKSRAREKRGGPTADNTDTQVEGMEPTQGRSQDILALDEALESLSQLEPRLADVIELNYFGGLTHDQIAVAVGVSTKTVQRDLRLGRAWLLKELAGVSSP